jgi:serine/threonine-protein kinase
MRRIGKIILQGPLGKTGVSLFTDFSTAAVLSPDGAVLAFVAMKSAEGPRQVYVRRLDQLVAAPLPGTEGAFGPFFSPDGEWIAFFAGGKLKKVSVSGGASVTLADAVSGSSGTWAEDGTIVFQPGGGPGVSLHRVSAAGGIAEPVTTLEPGEVVQRYPQVLPGGKALLYTSHRSQAGYENASLVVQPLPAGPRRVMQKGGYHGRYLGSGHLVYIREGTLFAVPFEPDHLELTGPPVPAVEGVIANPFGGVAQFAVSGNGTLAYLPGRSVSMSAPIHWMDQEGKTTPLRSVPANWSNLSSRRMASGSPCRSTTAGRTMCGYTNGRATRSPA